MKFRRRTAEPEGAADEVSDAGTEADEQSGPAGSDAAAQARTAGPLDSEEVDDEIERIDLGSLLIEPEDGLELRLQVDEETGAVQSVLLAGPDGALELRAFAAPRHGDLWSEVRPQIAADTAQRGGTASARDGRFGPELVCQMPVQLPDGSSGIQPTRIIGINGPRWLLRATFLGRPALEPEAAGQWEDALTRVVVHRGSHAMPVGDLLPVTLPENAQRLE